jgi:hypothetical protein
MKYIDPYGNQINNIQEWESALFGSGKKERHWKPGRSAHSLASYIFNDNGEQKIADLLSKLFGSKVILETGYPEQEVRFDKYGHGREHDLGLHCRLVDEDKTIYVGLEAKVDEEFNISILQNYLKAKCKELSNTKTNAGNRIENLLQKHFKEVKPSHFELKYQLLYSTVGTLEAKDKDGKYFDEYVFLVIVFKTDKYDEVKSINNYRDYIEFVSCCKNINKHNIGASDARTIEVDNKPLHTVYMDFIMDS